MTGTDMELLDERYMLVMDRIRDIDKEDAFGDPLLSFFHTCSALLIFLAGILERSLERGTEGMTTEELAAENHKLYADIAGKAYEQSFANPDYIVAKFEEAGITDAKDLARYLCFILAQIRGLIPYAYEGRKEIFTIHAEFFTEIYTAFRLNALDGT